jgi:hypothetical protein
MDEKQLIEFVSLIPHLSELEDVRPQPVRNFIPKWWKDMPAHHAVDTAYPEMPTVKSCPGIRDLFTKGFVIPMWADTTIKFNSETGEWQWRCGQEGSPYHIKYFNPMQLMQYAPEVNIQGAVATAAFQFQSPWRIITPPGYSVLQLPMFYHFNKDFSILPGIVDTDVYNIFNNEFLYFGNSKEIFIKRGTPLVHIFPFKRSDLELEVRDANEKDFADIKKHSLDMASTFRGRYQQHQKDMKNQLASEDGNEQ